MGIFDKLFGGNSSINYDCVDYLATHNALRQLVAMGNRESENGKVYYKPELASAITAFGQNPNKDNLKQLLNVWPDFIKLVEYNR